MYPSSSCLQSKAWSYIIFWFLILQASNSAIPLPNPFPPKQQPPPQHFPLCLFFSSFPASPPFSAPFFETFPLQIESFKLNFRENARSRTDHGADIVTWPAHQDNNSPHPHAFPYSPNQNLHHHPAPRSISLMESLAAAGYVSSPSAPSLLNLQEEVQGENSGLPKGSWPFLSSIKLWQPPFISSPLLQMFESSSSFATLVSTWCYHASSDIWAHRHAPPRSSSPPLPYCIWPKGLYGLSLETLWRGNMGQQDCPTYLAVSFPRWLTGNHWVLLGCIFSRQPDAVVWHHVRPHPII